MVRSKVALPRLILLLFTLPATLQNLFVMLHKPVLTTVACCAFPSPLSQGKIPKILKAHSLLPPAELTSDQFRVIFQTKSHLGSPQVSSRPFFQRPRAENLGQRTWGWWGDASLHQTDLPIPAKNLVCCSEATASQIFTRDQIPPPSPSAPNVPKDSREGWALMWADGRNVMQCRVLRRRKWLCRMIEQNHLKK